MLTSNHTYIFAYKYLKLTIKENKEVVWLFNALARAIDILLYGGLKKIASFIKRVCFIFYSNFLRVTVRSSLINSADHSNLSLSDNSIIATMCDGIVVFIEP